MRIARIEGEVCFFLTIRIFLVILLVDAFVGVVDKRQELFKFIELLVCLKIGKDRQTHYRSGD